MADVAVTARLRADEARVVLDLLDAAGAVDGVAPVDEQGRLRAGGAGRRSATPDGTAAAASGVRHLLVHGLGAALEGYAQLDLGDPGGPVAQLVVAPSVRRQGLGRALLSTLEAEAGRERLRVWAHGDLPTARSFAAATGYEPERTLLVLGRSLVEPPLPPLPDPPPGVRVAAFRPGADDAAWVDANARAFAAHPEQGRLTLADLADRTSQPWFDPAGFFLAWRDERLVGFHWTKVHTDADGAHGEVYVLGIDPDEQGRGLGRSLTLVGLHHLRDRGLAEVLLYVEGDNAPALHTYERLGFERRSADVRYARGRGAIR